jgi:predicted nuclease of predicted toxin-antitoxin system
LRLLLDAHVSGPRIATALRERGHDVRAADEERELDGWADEALLVLAAGEERVLVSFDVKDFPEIARRWAEAERPHAGLAIVVGIDHGEFGTILRALGRLLEERSDPGEWRDYTCFVSRGQSAA